MEDLIIGLQIRPTIELTHKGDNLKVKFLVEDIEDVYEHNNITIVKYYSNEFVVVLQLVEDNIFYPLKMIGIY